MSPKKVVETTKYANKKSNIPTYIKLSVKNQTYARN